MDEVDQRERPKRTRVLRATDIIPPFDNVPVPEDAGPTETESPREEPVGALDNEWPESSMDGEPSPSGEPAPDAAADEIPKYDLAENILAEQRRVAARRRRAPSQPQEEPSAQSESRDPEPVVLELPSEDLPELQRVVAEIVARDIERLCRRSDN